MKNVIPSWGGIFALVFAVVFLAIIAWMYRKDIHMHRKYYKGSVWVLLTVIAFLALFFLIKSRILHF